MFTYPLRHDPGPANYPPGVSVCLSPLFSDSTLTTTLSTMSTFGPNFVEAKMGPGEQTAELTNRIQRLAGSLRAVDPLQLTPDELLAAAQLVEDISYALALPRALERRAERAASSSDGNTGPP